MRTRAWLVRGIGAMALVMCAAAPGSALPPDGAGSDTPGTSASVSPRSVAPGGLIRFTVGGFPAGETVYVKIDDGASCSADAAQGACVYHSQKLDSRGSASGSFTLPKDLRAGAHWLRFLASEEITDAAGGFQGTKGFTRRGGADFTVVAASAGSGRSSSGDDKESGSSGGAAAPTTAAPSAVEPGTTPEPGGSAMTAQGGIATIVPPPAAVSSAPGVAPTSDVPAETVQTSAASEGSGGFPLVGAIGFAVMLALAAVISWRGLRRSSSVG